MTSTDPAATPLPIPPDAVAATAAAILDFRRLKRTVLAPDDVQTQGALFLKDSGFDKLSYALGVSCSLRQVTVERITNPEVAARLKANIGDLYAAEAWVRAESPTGRHCDALGACSIVEDTYTYKADGSGHKKGDAIINARLEAEHNVRATAVTKAKKQACDSLYMLEPITMDDVKAINERFARERQRSGRDAQAAQPSAQPSEKPAPESSVEQQQIDTENRKVIIAGWNKDKAVATAQKEWLRTNHHTDSLSTAPSSTLQAMADGFRALEVPVQESAAS